MSIDPSAGVGSLPPLPIDNNPVPTNPSNVTQVILPLEEFAEDLDLRLGRANGNVFQRRPGIEGSHDGQVMVRLKKNVLLSLIIQLYQMKWIYKQVQ